MTEHVLTNEQKKLVEDNVPLAHFIAHRVNHPHIEYEDAVQLALLGFCKAARLYDPKKSKFTTLATLAAKHTIQMEERKYRNEVAKALYCGRSLDSDIFEQDFGCYPLHETIPDPRQDTYKQAEAKIALERVDSFMRSLNNRDRAVFNYHVLSGMTQQEIADRTGLSQSYVSRVIRRLMSRVNSILGLEEAV